MIILFFVKFQAKQFAHPKIRSHELWQFKVDGSNVLHDFNLGIVFACKNSGKRKNLQDNRYPSQEETGVQRYIWNDISIFVVVVPALFRSCVTQLQWNQRVCVICQRFDRNLCYSTESKWRWWKWQMPALLKGFIAVKLITWVKLTRLIRVVIWNAWGKTKISTGLRNYYRFTASSNNLKLIWNQIHLLLSS